MIPRPANARPAPRAHRRIERFLACFGALLAVAGAARGQPAGPGEGLRIDLPTALRLADERNLDVAIFIERIAEAQADVDEARSLAIPSITVGGSYNRHDGVLQEAGGRIIDVESVSRYGGLGAGAIAAGDPRVPGVSLEVNVADAIFQRQVARQNLAGIAAEAERNRHEVLLEVATAYLQLVRARAEGRLALASLERARDLASLTADYADAGEGLLADAELAGVQHLLFEQRLVRADEQAIAANAALARLLHFDSDVELEAADESPPPLELIPAEEDLPSLLGRALDGRPEQDQLEALLAAAEADLTAERYGLLIPTVSLGYSSGRFGGGPGSAINDTADRDDFTMLLYWRFDHLGFGNRARLDRKRAEVRRLGLERERLHDAIVAEVTEGHARLASLRRQIELLERAVAGAEEAYRLHRERIFDQLGVPLEALSAMQTLATAEASLLEAQVAYALGQVRLYTAIGSPVDDVR